MVLTVQKCGQDVEVELVPNSASTPIRVSFKKGDLDSFVKLLQMAQQASSFQFTMALPDR